MQNNAIAQKATSNELSFATASDGTSIAYRRSGRSGKQKVLLLHSLALDGTVWDGVADELDDDAEVIRIDCRGHGASGKPPGPYTVDLLAEDAADILALLGWEEVIVAGCSMGGCVAQAFAANHPKRTAALALIDTTAWYGPTALQDWDERAKKARADGFASMAQFQTTRWFGDAYRDRHPDIVQRYMTTFSGNDIDAYASTCKMMGTLDLRVASSTIKVPTAVIVGEEDYAAPLAMAKALHGLVEDSTLTILANARHLTPIECPGPIASEIRGLAARLKN
ncbi:alpha/beta fold hydrolase [Brucella anthropi]|uniref:alpha/beta fold hydrolase n=1 Tax=Brucella anthropi TaxID=529 RepID=UPI00124F0CCE|nr:alpha/beta hydrolase [Brucella anthropi]KAB2784179.1 alpha/beta fold hydrolase [Brucella anthropi]KAB2793111.1 alpha/beta fold hydrolase [Brucella anthropi]